MAHAHNVPMDRGKTPPIRYRSGALAQACLLSSTGKLFPYSLGNRLDAVNAFLSIDGINVDAFNRGFIMKIFVTIALAILASAAHAGGTAADELKALNAEKKALRAEAAAMAADIKEIKAADRLERVREMVADQKAKMAEKRAELRALVARRGVTVGEAAPSGPTH